MAEIGVEIRGLEEAYRRLGADVLSVLRPPMYRAVIEVEGIMKKYPPPRADQKYVRRGTLGRRWTHEVTQTATSITGEVGNNTSYGPWVQSEQFQAWMHRGRWETDEGALRTVQPHFVQDAEQAVLQALEGD